MFSNDDDEKLKILSSHPPEEYANFHEAHDAEAPLEVSIPMGGTIEFFRARGAPVLYLIMLLLALAMLGAAIGMLFTPGAPPSSSIGFFVGGGVDLLLMLLIPARYELYKGGLRIHLSWLGYFGWGPKLNYPASQFRGSPYVISNACGNREAAMKWGTSYNDILSLPRYQNLPLHITPENVEHFQRVFREATRIF